MFWPGQKRVVGDARARCARPGRRPSCWRSRKVAGGLTGRPGDVGPRLKEARTAIKPSSVLGAGRLALWPGNFFLRYSPNPGPCCSLPAKQTCSPPA